MYRKDSTHLPFRRAHPFGSLFLEKPCHFTLYIAGPPPKGIEEDKAWNSPPKFDYSVTQLLPGRVSGVSQVSVFFGAFRSALLVFPLILFLYHCCDSRGFIMKYFELVLQGCLGSLGHAG